MACALPGRVALEHRYAGAALRKPPGDRQADHAGTDDRHFD